MTGLHRLFEAVGEGELDRICERLDVQLLGVFGSAAHRFRQGNAWAAPKDLDICVQFSGENAPLSCWPSFGVLLATNRSISPC